MPYTPSPFPPAFPPSGVSTFISTSIFTCPSNVFHFRSFSDSFPPSPVPLELSEVTGQPCLHLQSPSACANCTRNHWEFTNTPHISAPAPFGCPPLSHPSSLTPDRVPSRARLQRGRQAIARSAYELVAPLVTFSGLQVNLPAAARSLETHAALLQLSSNHSAMT